MNAKSHALGTNANTVVGHGFDRVLAANGREISGTVRKAGLFAKNVGLFFASPFIALGYVIALPFVGFYMIAKLGLEAYAKK